MASEALATAVTSMPTTLQTIEERTRAVWHGMLRGRA